VRRLLVLLGSLAILAVPGGASASPLPVSHGGTIAALNANQSTNWFGYNQGALEKGTPQFTSITGDWTVPTATQHTKGEDEYSSTWIGIGGGCVDSSCLVGDPTLIQTGTEQDVVGGAAQYSAWWEIIPGPSISISMPVAPGDHMHADITEVVPESNVWTITLQNVTKGQTFTQTVPYTSSHLTAEWIEETPLILGTNAGFAALPNLSRTSFTGATVNGANANLVPAEMMQLVNSAGAVYATPSAPTSTKDGFAECTWATTC
jgi:hypothetical protein